MNLDHVSKREYHESPLMGTYVEYQAWEKITRTPTRTGVKRGAAEIMLHVLRVVRLQAAHIQRWLPERSLYWHEPIVLFGFRRGVSVLSGAKVYTRVGPVLMSINPYKWIKGLYTEAAMIAYHGKASLVEAGELAPHLFGVADHAYSQLVSSSFSTLLFHRVSALTVRS